MTETHFLLKNLKKKLLNVAKGIEPINPHRSLYNLRDSEWVIKYNLTTQFKTGKNRNVITKFDTVFHLKMYSCNTNKSI